MALKGNILKIIVVSAVVLFLTNFGLIIYHFFYSDVQYFNKEHLIEGGVFSLVTAFLLFRLAIHTNKLRQNEERLNSFFEASSDFICILDLHGNIIRTNQSMINRSGYGKDELIGHAMHEFISPSSQIICEEQFPVLLKEGQNRVEIEFVRKEGTIINMDCSTSAVHDKDGRITSFMMIQRDITDRVQFEKKRKKLEEGLFMKQKESSILTLAGGIAHDFNNILMSVIGNAELLKMRGVLKEDEEELIQNILASSERMADLTKQLVAYAKGGMYHKEIVSINNLIHEDLKLAYKGESPEIEIMLDLSEKLWPVLADPEQIKQALKNIFTNAFEAMEKGGGGLSVHTSNVSNKDTWECPILRHEHQGGDYVYIRISDTGHGMSETTIKRIFDPFFTTKFMGRGLGLPAAVGIIQNHNGCISVESEINKGSVFHVYLPSAEAMAKKETERISPVKDTVGNKILVVEDEPQILELMQDMLLRMGYQVLKASDGEKALEIFRNEKDDIKMVIIDILMPGMDGRRLFKALKDVNPDIKVLISSGYDETTALEGMAPYRPEGYIQKPYRFSSLKEKLSEILKDR